MRFDRSALAAALLLAAPAAAQPPRSAEAELIQLEQAYAKALIARDVEFLKGFYAPDWRGGDWMGFASKTNIINLIKSARYVVKSMVLRDLRVRVIGDVAIVQGVDEEVTSMHGRDTSGTWGFTDVFARRGGRWVAIASQTTRIEKGR
ncbi:MAG: nuclear transport factor 2 family protein [Alphaproteobacteria bacterium]|nr:nuclear transport factor 2 family protein [Alphaproteobacteria bacterium]MBV9373012.1 nuclear transport factor 2 family protein [Alphaproteobacteria bacterium]MBV9902895.1 nuclear transport factor 2 family protein [Alphaproteobacteria bacterium]